MLFFVNGNTVKQGGGLEVTHLASSHVGRIPVSHLDDGKEVVIVYFEVAVMMGELAWGWGRSISHVGRDIWCNLKRRREDLA